MGRKRKDIAPVNDRIFRRCNSLKQDNKGLTLIELLVAMVISSIVIIMVAMFISLGSRNYNYASKEIKLQMQAQTVTNQLDDMIISSNWLESRDLSDDVKAYVIYSGTDINVIFYDKSTDMLYIKDGFEKAEIPALTTSSYSKRENLMSANVSYFNLKLNRTENEVSLTMKMINDTADYSAIKTIALRNQVKEPD